MEIAPIWRKDGPSVPTRKAALDTGRAFVRHSHSSNRSNELGRSWVCRYRSSIGWRPPPATCSPLEVFLRNMLALDAVVPVRRLLALVEPFAFPLRSICFASLVRSLAYYPRSQTLCHSTGKFPRSANSRHLPRVAMTTRSRIPGNSYLFWALKKSMLVAEPDQARARPIRRL